MNIEFEDSSDSEKTENALSYLRRESVDLFNRLHSIEEDVTFVNRVRKAYPEIPILRS